MSDDYAPQAWRFGDGPNQFYADQYATTTARLDYDLDYDESRFNQHKAEFLADLAAHDAEVAARAAERVLAVILDDLDTARESHQTAHSWDDALHFVRGYVSGAAINTRAEHMERKRIEASHE